jgi:hypothetical protein
MVSQWGRSLRVERGASEAKTYEALKAPLKTALGFVAVGDASAPDVDVAPGINDGAVVALHLEVAEGHAGP